MTTPTQYHNTELEQAALNSLLTGLGASLLSRLRPEDFFSPDHQKVFEACYTDFLEHGSCDFTSVHTRLSAENWYNAKGGIVYLTELTRFVNVYMTRDDRLFTLLRDLSIRREAERMGIHGGTSADVVHQLTQRIEELHTLLPTTTRRPADVLHALLSSPPRAIPFGFPCLDNLVVMHPGHLVVVGARPGVGKSSFLCNVACNHARSGKNIVYCTKEMSYEELLPRFLSYLSGTPFHELRDKARSHEEVINRISVEEKMDHVGDVEAVASRTEADVIIVDYLQLLTVPGRRPANRVQELEEITRRLKGLAQRTGKVILCAAQLNRDLENAARKPVLSDLRGSGSMEQDANIVLMLHNPCLTDDEDGEKAANRWEKKRSAAQVARSLEVGDDMVDVLIRKNRAGKRGSVRLKWVPELTAFRDVSGAPPHPAFSPQP